MVSTAACSKEVLDTIPLVMRTIRSEMRRQRQQDLSVPQFRTLGFVGHNPGASLSQVAEHVGLPLSSMSKTVDGLVERGLVAHGICRADQRRASLSLTGDGASVLEVARKATQARLAELLDPLPDGERTRVAEAMRFLQRAFAAGAGGDK
ncbi:MAG: MarR family transcriptional regulator [Planctomycetota bacterium]